MQDPSNRGPHRLLNRFRMHPTNAGLVAFRDGELPLEDQARIREHLQHCVRCRKEARSIEEDLELFTHLAADVDVEPEVEAGLQNLQKAMDDRNVEAPVRVPSPSTIEIPVSPAILASICKELSIYLGVRAARKVMARMETATFSAEDLVGNIGPLMVGLLGDRGGSAVAGKIAMLCRATTMQSGSVTQ